MAVNDQKVTLNFVHPTESGKLLQAAVAVTATPHYLIGQLEQSNFIEKAGNATQYKLVDPATGKQLLDHATLEAANIKDNAHLQVVHSVTGAGA